MGFFNQKTGGVGPLLCFIKNKEVSQNKVSRNKKRDKENKKNYTASSHGSIWGWYFPFALRITRANSSLKIELQRWVEGGKFLKIISFQIVQMDQHIVTTISMKKGSRIYSHWQWLVRNHHVPEWQGSKYSSRQQQRGSPPGDDSARFAQCTQL